jgi:hypothetical protein
VPDASRYLQFFIQPYSYLDLEHINHFTIGSLYKCFEKYNYNIIDSWSLSYEMNSGIKYPAIGLLLNKSEKRQNFIESDISNIYEYLDVSFEKINSEINVHDLNGKVLYGCGANTLRTISMLNLNFNEANYFVDKNPAFSGRKIANIEIYDINYVINDSDIPDIVVFSKLYENDIISNLRALGYKGNIIPFYNK